MNSTPDRVSIFFSHRSRLKPSRLSFAKKKIICIFYFALWHLQQTKISATQIESLTLIRFQFGFFFLCLQIGSLWRFRLKTFDIKGIKHFCNISSSASRLPHTHEWNICRIYVDLKETFITGDLHFGHFVTSRCIRPIFTWKYTTQQQIKQVFKPIPNWFPTKKFNQTCKCSASEIVYKAKKKNKKFQILFLSRPTLYTAKANENLWYWDKQKKGE